MVTNEPVSATAQQPDKGQGAAIMLRGFVGDYRGSKVGMSCYRPVFDAEGRTWVALSNAWDENSIQPIDQDDLNDFVHQLPERPIQIGDVVWLAGQIFANRCEDVEGYGNRIKVWSSFTSEYKFSVGSLARLVELSRQIFAAAARQMHRALFDPREYSAGRATRMFEVLNHLYFAPKYQQQLERALYYSEAHDEAHRLMVRTDAVLDGLFPTAADFDRELDALRSALAQKKLRYGTPTRTTEPEDFLASEAWRQFSRANDARSARFWLSEISEWEPVTA